MIPENWSKNSDFRLGISASKIMFTSRNQLNLHLLIVPLSLSISILYLSSPVSAIRMDASSQENNCRTTVPGRFLLTDDNGHVCDALSVDPLSRCCTGKGDQFSCHGCNLVSQCCNSYEYCVSCCLNPALTDKELALKVEIAKPVTAGLYGSVFDFCAGRCRHNSESVVHENAYLSVYHHCFTIPSNSSGSSDKQAEARLVGINIIIGSIQKYMSCKGSCLSSVGADQPAEVVDDAPKHLNPGACLFTKTPSMLSCNGSHRHTKRLCPCA